KSAVPPTMIVGLAGLTFNETGTTAPPTTRTTPGETTEPIVAVMVVPPALTLVASPVEALMVATAGVEEAQVACEVTSAVLESVYVPVAVNCNVPGREAVAGFGVTAIDCRAITVRVTPGDTTVPCVAVI